MSAANQINAMSLNSKAVNSMIQNDHHESMVSFKFALQSCRTEIENEHQQEEQPHPAWTIRPIALPTGNFQADACGAFAVFTGAFVFVDDDEGNGPAAKEVMNHRLIPAALLYNMGLCHHQEAMRYSGCCALGFDMARRFYSYALTLLEEVSEDIRQSDLLLLAALTNNMACITNFFCDASTTKIFGGMLADVLSHTDMKTQLGEEDAFVFFSRNVMMVTELTLNGIAPAA
jgi:hypothetical protein